MKDVFRIFALKTKHAFDPENSSPTQVVHVCLLSLAFMIMSVQSGGIDIDRIGSLGHAHKNPIPSRRLITKETRQRLRAMALYVVDSVQCCCFRHHIPVRMLGCSAP